MATTQLEVIISAKDNFTATANRISGTLGRLGKAGQGVGQMASGFAKLGVIAGGVAAAGIFASARAAMNWESALAGVNKTMDLTPKELQVMGRSIRDLSLDIPISANAIAGLVEQAGALGIAKNDVVEFARVAATIGVTTNVSADQAATALGGMANLLGLTGDEFSRFASTLVDLGNKGASTEAAILAIAERAAGAGAAIGLSAESVLAFSAAVGNLQIEPEAGGSSLQRLFIDTAKAVAEGDDALNLFAKTAGVSSKAFADLFGSAPQDALSKFIVGLSKLTGTQQLSVLEGLDFNDIRITRMLLGLAKAEKETGNLAKSLGIAQTAWGANTAAAEEAAKRYATIESAFGKLKNSAIDAAITVGEGMLPALGRAATRLSAVLKDPSVRNDLRAIGQDIGKMIEGIDWKAVIDGARSFVALIRAAATLLRGIPNEIKLAGVALIGLGNTPFLGGALKDIVGGAAKIGGAAAGMLGKGGGVAGQVGKLLAQPVFVTNWPPGMGLGGGGGVAGVAGKGAGVVGTAVKLLPVIGVGMIVGEAMKALNQGLGVTARNPREAGMRAAMERVKAQVQRMPPKQDRTNLWLGQLQRVGERNTTRLSLLGLAAQRAGERTVGQLAQVRSANLRVYDAIERKRLSVKVSNPVTVNVAVSARTSTHKTTTSQRYSPNRSYMV